MLKFINRFFDKPAYFKQALFLYKKYSRFLDDDFALNEMTAEQYFVQLVLRTSPFFYLVIEDDNVCGIIYLDNIIGDSKNLHSAELNTCFDKKYWGAYPKICAILFMKYFFDVCGFKKIKALVYPENHRVKNILKFAGFEFEALLKSETMRNNKLQDIEIYSCRKAEK